MTPTNRPAPLPSRSYRGDSAEKRRAVRRLALMEAGRELWCELGWAGVTMRGVCARATLSDRYFYESFPDCEHLLVAVGEMVRDETVALLLAATRAHRDASPLTQLKSAIAAIVELIANDPGGVQIFFGDHGGSRALETLRRDTIGAVVDLFIELTKPHVLAEGDETEFRVALVVGIGGFVEAVTAWRSGVLDTTNERLIEMLMDVGRRLGQGFVEFSPSVGDSY